MTPNSTIPKSALAMMGLSTIAAACIAIAGSAPARSDEKVGAITIAHASARVAPPQSGVKLLEDIIMRMHSLPQLAMAKNKQSYQYQQSQSLAQANTAAPLADPLLAIKPKEKSKYPYPSSQMAAQNTLASLPATVASRGYSQQSQQSQQQSFDESRAIASRKEVDADDLRAKLNKRSAATTAEPQTKGQASNEYERTANHAANAPAEAPAGQSRADVGARNRESKDARDNEMLLDWGNTNKIVANAKARANTLSPESQRRLSGSFGKLYDGMRQLEEINQIANTALGSSRPADKKESYKKVHAPGRQVLIADRPANITEYRGYQGAGAAGEASLQGATNGTAGPMQEQSAMPPPPPATVMRPVQPGLYRTTRDFSKEASAAQAPATPAPSATQPPASATSGGGGGTAAGDAFATDTMAAHPKADSAGSKNSKTGLIALLPPNVITGIPLMRLGSSAMEANRNLSGMGTISKQQINGWAVWSLSRPRSREVMLQIYMRHGMVEAMRIFDPSLIAADLGVNLGDDLAVVKKRFGEPAFILTEPTLTGGSPGQNYVYPISQVSFQLARQSNHPAPQVMSLLIFNVK